MIRLLRGAMPLPPVPPPPRARTSGIPAARPLPRRPCAPPLPAAAGKKKQLQPEPLLSSSWPSATLPRPRARRGPCTPQPTRLSRAPPPTSLGRTGTATTCAAPRRQAGGHPGTGAAAAGGFSLSLAPEAVLLIQRRHLERPLLAPPRGPSPAPSAGPGRPLGPCPRARVSGVASRQSRAALLPSGLQTSLPGPRPFDLRPVLQVSLLNDKHRYDDVEYEDEPAGALDEGLVRKCTEWLRGVESATAVRGRNGHLDTLPHLSTL